MLPLNDSGILSGLLCGFLFGFVLEQAGFGSPRKLTAQFRFNDWAVFKVMFTAIAVAAIGLYALRQAGLIDADAIYVPSSLLVAAAIGGALVGAGFAIGGYCPGTSLVGLCSGRGDAAVFLVGLLLGTFVFAGLYGEGMEALMAMAEVESGDTFSEAWGISEPLILGIILAALGAVFYVGTLLEKRSADGPITAEHAQACWTVQDKKSSSI